MKVATITMQSFTLSAHGIFNVERARKSDCAHTGKRDRKRMEKRLIG